MPTREGDVLVSGIKPTGVPHLGNLLGMIRPAARLAADHTAFLFVADLHALTTVRNGAELRAHTYDAVATLLAMGVDPERTVLFRQSDVPEILELAWVLACLAPNPLLERAHAFKAATAEGMDPSLGLFSYPVLMAADILALGGTVVPVGADQRQHVEITRDLARRFNHAFGSALTVPRATVVRSVAVIPGIDGRKMSKRYGNTIPITATPEERRALVRRIVTDSSAADAPKDPDASPVIGLLGHFAGPEAVHEMAEGLRAGRLGWADAKDGLADALDRELEPVRERFLRHRSDERGMEATLRAGAARARARASEIVSSVRDLTGIGGPPSSARIGGPPSGGRAGGRPKSESTGGGRGRRSKERTSG